MSTATTDIKYIYNPSRTLEIVLCRHSASTYPLHNHTSVLTMILLLAGSIELAVGSQLHSLVPDELQVIPPYTPHSLSTKSSYSLLSLCINKDYLLNNQLSIVQQVRELLELLNTNSSCEQINQQHIKQLLRHLNSLDVRALQSTVSTDCPYLQLIKRQLEECPEQRLDIAQMAKIAFSSKYQFIRRFKQVVGLTPHQFQLQNRIRKAQRMFHTRPSIASVALSTGFCDQSHFIKQFEKHLRLTPTAYLNACSPVQTTSIT